jgi:hypothetical protein
VGFYRTEVNYLRSFTTQRDSIPGGIVNTLYINEINPHPGPHLDEVVASVLARRFGGNKIVIADDVKVVPEMLEGTEVEHLWNGRLPLGQLRGVFDDKDLLHGDRIPGECCATRMATFVGVRNEPCLERLFRAVNRVDGDRKATPTDLSSFIKQVIDNIPSDSHPGIFIWAEQGVQAIITYLYLPNPPQCKNYVRPLDVFNFLVGSQVTDQRVIERMRRLLASADTQVESCIELSYISRAMKVIGCSDEVVIHWLTMGLVNYAEQAVQYWEALKEVEPLKPYWIPRQLEDDVPCIFIRSGNLQVAKASRSEKFQYALCIVRRPSRHASIIVNAHDNLDMRGIWALLRLEETPIEKRAKAIWEEYCLPGNHSNASHWHMMKDGAALNGSNHIKVKKVTELSDEALIRITKIGLTDMARTRFDFLVRLARKEFPPVQQKAPHRVSDEKAAPVTVAGEIHLDSAGRAELRNVLDQK